MALKYYDRNSRQKFIADYFSESLNGSVLNVGGGGERSLGKLISATRYAELDIDGSPDYKINLETEYPLPIMSNSYDTVVCTDVLEHLDEFHRVFSELIRLSNKNIIISLPNALRVYYRYLLRREYNGGGGAANECYGKYAKYWGLPLKKPSDRHKWFISYTDAMNFINVNADRYGYEVVQEIPVWGINSNLPEFIQAFSSKLLSKSDIMLDLFADTYWCLLKKKEA